MDIDEFKTTNQEADYNKEEVFSKLKMAVDENSKKQRRKGMVFAVVLVVLASLYVVSITGGEKNFNTGIYLVAGGFFLGALYLYFKSRLISGSLYSLSSRDFFETAYKRLQYMRAIDIVIILPLIILLGTGGGMILISRLLNYTDNKSFLILIWIVFYTALCAFGLIAGKKNWEKEHRDLFNEIKKLRQSFEEDNL